MTRGNGKGNADDSTSSPFGSFTPSDNLQIDPRQLLQYFVDKQFEPLAKKLLEGIFSLGSETFLKIGPSAQKSLDEFMSLFLYFFTQPELKLTSSVARMFLLQQPMIAHLLNQSCFQNTDAALKMVLQQPENLLKVLTLTTARSQVKVDRELLFSIDAKYASVWYLMWYFTSESCASPVLYNNMIEHQRSFDSRFMLPDINLTEAFFSSTYIDPGSARKLKQELNLRIREMGKSFKVKNHPHPGRIAVLTNSWSPTHSTYRSMYPFIAPLKEEFDLVLIHLSAERKDPDLGLFSEVRKVSFEHGKVAIDAVIDNDFQVVIYPDAGLDPESRLLSNLRLAPIQVACYGNPVSTFGSEIDYYIGGEEVEMAHLAQENYSERLVLIPGLGAHPVYPNYRVQNLPCSTDPLVINCCWSSQKINYPLLASLKKMQDGFHLPCRFRFFPGTLALRFNSFLSLQRDIETVLGSGNVEVVPHCDYQQYMSSLEQGILTLDSYPFGGYNTIVDSLHVGVPVITWEGTTAPNRIASQVLRKLGLNELIATNESEYIEKATALVNRENLRTEISNRIKQINLTEALTDQRECRCFKKAIEYLIGHQDVLRRDSSREPIRIGLQGRST